MELESGQALDQMLLLRDRILVSSVKPQQQMRPQRSTSGCNMDGDVVDVDSRIAMVGRHRHLTPR